MSLPQTDQEYLAERKLSYTLGNESNMICLVIQGFPLPSGYDKPQSDLLLRLNPGYPDVPPDMWWFDPPILLSDGRTIHATDSRESYLGRTWQRWSRHFNPGQWQSGIDCLESFIALIKKELQRCTISPAP